MTQLSDAMMSALVSDCIQREGLAFHMYRDSLGYVTVGIGNKVDSPKAAEALPFIYNGRTPGDDWRRVYAMPEGHPARFYLDDESPQLPRDYPEVLCRQRLTEEFLPGISRVLPDVMEYPLPAIRALTCMAYACGVHGLSTFTHMIAACKSRDWKGAAASCHVRSAREETNQRNADWLIEAAG